MATADGVGGKIARIREARKLSQDELAERSQVAPGLLRQIEQGELIPSLTPLTKIARVLGVRMGTFLDDVEQVGPVLNRKGQIRQTVRFAPGSHPARGELDFHALALDKAGRHMEPFLIDVLPASDKSYEKSSPRRRGVPVRPRRPDRAALRQGQLRAVGGRQHLLRLHRGPPRPRGWRRPRPDPGRGLRSLLRGPKMELLEKTIGAVIEEQVALFPDEDFIVYADRGLRFTYRQFDARVNAMARGFLAMGVGKGDKVGIWATNVPDWFTVFFATAKIGATLVTVNTGYRLYELEYLVR